MGKAGKNTHMTHLDEFIITDGLAGGKKAIEILKYMGDFLQGNGNRQVAVTTKWDGAPAIICGIDPSDGKFFVGTKSVFAQNAKICKSQNDIQELYSGVLADKLSSALRNLNGCVRGVLQGDLMFTNDKTRETIDNQRFITFRPNTITYAVQPDTELGRQIDNAQIGIVFHTKYTGPSLPEMTASFDVTKNDYIERPGVWIDTAEFKDIGGVATMSGGERMKYDAAVRRAEGSLRKTGSILDKIQTGKKTLEIDTELLKFFNNYVKEGRDVPSVDMAYRDFMYYLGNSFNKAIKPAKRLETQADKAYKFVERIEFIEKNQREFKMMIALYMNLQFAKNMLVDKLKKVSALRLFVNMGTHYEATTPEGFVAISGRTAVKLIDRLEFSRLNFTVPKQWE